MAPVMHACGHDMHVAWLVGATTLLAQSRDTWQGTLMAVFQPAEETAEGAQAMIDDGLFDRFPKPTFGNVRFRRCLARCGASRLTSLN